MSASEEPVRQPRVFVSYHHDDNEAKGLYQGKITEFAEYLERAISDDTGITYQTVYIDYREKTSDLEWREKIEAELKHRTVLVIAIITPGYLRSETCQWEWGVYRDLYSSHDRPRTFFPVRLCGQAYFNEELNKPHWAHARDQWEEPLELYKRAFQYGPSDSAWTDLILKMASESITWITGKPVQVSNVGFAAPPTVGTPVRITATTDPSVTQEVRAWLVDGNDVDTVGETYTPTPADLGKHLSATVRFSRDDHLAVWKTIDPVQIDDRASSLSIGEVLESPDDRSGNAGASSETPPLHPSAAQAEQPVAGSPAPGLSKVGHYVSNDTYDEPRGSLRASAEEAIRGELPEDQRTSPTIVTTSPRKDAEQPAALPIPQIDPDLAAIRKEILGVWDKLPVEGGITLSARLTGHQWRALDRMSMDGVRRVLLLSEFVLEFRRYHEKLKNVTWSSCSLREYLNDEKEGFLVGFSSAERAAMVEVRNKNPKNPR